MLSIKDFRNSEKCNVKREELGFFSGGAKDPEATGGGLYAFKKYNSDVQYYEDTWVDGPGNPGKNVDDKGNRRINF